MTDEGCGSAFASQQIDIPFGLTDTVHETRQEKEQE